jgi:hypothetical protein
MFSFPLGLHHDFGVLERIPAAGRARGRDRSASLKITI